MTKQEISGFNRVPESSLFAPLLMCCRVVDDTALTSSALLTVGRAGPKVKKLASDCTYALWVLYSRDAKGNDALYFKEQQDSIVYKLVKERFEFVFEAESFTHIAMNYGTMALKYFMSHGVVEDKEELFKFLRQIKENATERKRDVVREFLCTLKIKFPV